MQKTLLHQSKKRQTEAEIQRLSEKSFAIKEKIICDFERFNELSFEQKRAVANAIIKKIYVSKPLFLISSRLRFLVS